TLGNNATSAASEGKTVFMMMCQVGKGKDMHDGNPTASLFYTVDNGKRVITPGRIYDWPKMSETIFLLVEHRQRLIVGLNGTVARTIGQSTERCGGPLLIRSGIELQESMSNNTPI
ncbi:11913_t:CDS:2, partial [Acaulospora colombiana]